jgi:hypothetical protein
MPSIRERLQRLEDRRRFIDWFLRQRLWESLTIVQLEIHARDGRLPDPLPEPLPKGSSQLGRLGLKSLIKLWKESERIDYRSPDEQMFYAKNGYWPEQRMRPRFSLKDGRLRIEWQTKKASTLGNLR